MSKRYDVVARVIDRLTPETDRALVCARDDLEAIRHRTDDAVHRLMDARRSGLSAASYDNDTVHGGAAELTQTERLADAPDPAGKTIARLDDALRRLLALTKSPIVAQVQAHTVARHALTVRKIIEANAPRTLHNEDRRRREVEKANRTLLPECAHTRATVNTFEPVHRTTDLGGILPEALPLCRWVYDFARSNDRLPTQGEMERHSQGRMVRLPAT